METKMSNEDQSLEKEALEVAEGTPPVEKSEFSPDAITAISTQRTRAQNAELATARLQGQLDAQTAQNTQAAAVLEKSPIQLEMEKQGVSSIDDLELSTGETIRLMNQNQGWKENQTKKDAEQQVKDVQAQSREAAKAKYPDWMEVVVGNQDHLTIAEAAILTNAGADFGELAYEKCKVAAERMKPKTEEVAPEKKPGEPEPKLKAKVLTQDEILAAEAGADPRTLAVADM